MLISKRPHDKERGGVYFCQYIYYLLFLFPTAL